MLDHIILTVSDIKRAIAFYEAVLEPLGIHCFVPYKGRNGHPDLWGFRDGQRAYFWLKQGTPSPEAIHWASWRPMTRRSTRSTTQRLPLARRTTSRPVPAGVLPGYYAADVFDPDGYSFEVVHKS